MRAFSVWFGLSLFQLAIAPNALAATMECDRYIGTSDSKDYVCTYRIAHHASANVDQDTLEVKLIKKAETGAAGQFPLATGSDWKTVWRSKDSQRVVAVISDYTDDPFFSPVMMLDIDFAEVRMKYYVAGGFGSTEADVWKYECRRLE